MWLKHRGFFYLWTNANDNLHVPDTLAQASNVTLSSDCLKFLACLSPPATRDIEGISLHHYPALKTWLFIVAFLFHDFLESRAKKVPHQLHQLTVFHLEVKAL